MAATSRTPTCRNHCASCDQCFSSVAAFDSHRAGSHHDDSRYCETPSEDNRFVSTRGRCEIADPWVKRVGPIYGLAADQAQLDRLGP